MRRIYLILLSGLVAAASLLISIIHVDAWPDYNPGPGCGSCHASGATINAEYIGDNMVQVEVVNASEAVGGEIVIDGTVVDEVNGASNPFTLGVTEDGTYTVTAGLDSYHRYGSTVIEVTLLKTNTFSWGRIKQLFR